MNKHTPGPWSLSYDDRPDMEWNIHVVQADATHLTVCFMTSDGPSEANAKLIAAAPELLEAARKAEAVLARGKWLDTSPDPEAVALRELRAAIDKATR